MVYEMRVYTLQPGKVPEFQALIEKEALPVISKYSKLVGWWSTEVGPLNEVVHIWAYRDHTHMQEAKAQVNADPDWSGKYVPRVRPLIVAQKTYVMLSPDFAPQPF